MQGARRRFLHATGFLRPSTRRRRGPGPPTRRETDNTPLRVDPGACSALVRTTAIDPPAAACCVWDYEAHGPVRRHGRALRGSVRRPDSGGISAQNRPLWLTYMPRCQVAATSTSTVQSAAAT
jgi:hypothetical protein